MAALPQAFLAAMKHLDAVHCAAAEARRSGLWRRVARWFRRDADDAPATAHLSDHLLRDIGLTRAKAHDLFDRRRDPRF